MARSKSKKKSSSGLNPDAFATIRRALLGEGAEMAWRIGTLVVVLGLVVAWGVGRGPLKARASEGVNLVSVEIVSPGGLTPLEFDGPAEIETRLLSWVSQDLAHDPFDRATLERLRDDLASTGWFSSIGQVRRTPENVLRVEASWRVARAFVERGDRRYLVGEDGAPMRTFGLAGLSGPITILNPLEGVPRDASGNIAYGRPWGLSDVQDAIAIIDALRGAELDAYVASVDVDNPDRIMITSLRGARVVWGGPIDAPLPGEATADERLNALASVLRDPRHNQPMTWDVRFGGAQHVRLIGQ